MQGVDDHHPISPATPAGGTDRVIHVPCAWCGAQVAVNSRGRPARYCGRSCRQRAYELRTAAARHEVDIAAGRIAVEPAERVIERMVLARHPTRTSDWIRALEALAEQLHAGQIDPLHHHRLRQALQPILAALEPSEPAGETSRRHPGQWPSPAPDPAHDRTARALLACIPRLVDRTSLERLAALTGHDIDTTRAALTELTAAGLVTPYRQHLGGEPVPIDPDTLSPHAGFHIVATR